LKQEQNSRNIYYFRKENRGFLGLRDCAGRAQLTTGDAVREKVPLRAIGVKTTSAELRESAALARAHLWPVRAQSQLDAGKMFVDHVKLNRSGSIAGKLARASLSG
jgi:hypothetical protein